MLCVFRENYDDDKCPNHYPPVWQNNPFKNNSNDTVLFLKDLLEKDVVSAPLSNQGTSVFKVQARDPDTGINSPIKYSIASERIITQSLHCHECPVKCCIVKGRAVVLLHSWARQNDLKHIL